MYTAPFLRTSSLVLPAYRDFDVLTEAKKAGYDRFVSWAQVGSLPTHTCADLCAHELIHAYMCLLALDSFGLQSLTSKGCKMLRIPVAHVQSDS